MGGYVGSEPNCLLQKLSVFESSHLFKVLKNENFFGSDFEFCFIVSSALKLMFCKRFFLIGGDVRLFRFCLRL